MQGEETEQRKRKLNDMSAPPQLTLDEVVARAVNRAKSYEEPSNDLLDRHVEEATSSAKQIAAHFAEALKEAGYLKFEATNYSNNRTAYVCGTPEFRRAVLQPMLEDFEKLFESLGMTVSSAN